MTHIANILQLRCGANAQCINNVDNLHRPYSLLEIDYVLPFLEQLLASSRRVIRKESFGLRLTEVQHIYHGLVDAAGTAPRMAL